MKTFVTNLLICCSLAILSSCGSDEPQTTTTGTDTVETTPSVAEEPVAITKDNQLMKSISDTYFWVDKANDMPIFNEPCQVVDEALEIYYDENEISGWFINYGTYHRNYNYLVREVEEQEGEIIVRLVDSNDYDLADATEEVWSFRKDGDFLNWDRMDYDYTMYLLPYGKKDEVMVESCTDIEAILKDFPKEWIQLTEVPDSDMMLINECPCESGSVDFDLMKEDRKITAYHSWTGGCDGDSEVIKSIEKANNKVTIVYDRLDTEVSLEIDFDYFLTHVGTFRYISNGELTTRYFTPKSNAENFDGVACESPVMKE